MTVAIIGPHGVGKTTLGRALARALGCAYHEELGRTLAESRTLEPDVCQVDFDEAVLAAESARDRGWGNLGERLRVVESWHIGNLAYALTRSPDMCDTYASVSWGGALCIAMDADDATLTHRQTEQGAPEFFRTVGRLAPHVAHYHGVPVICTLDGAQPIGALIAQCLVALSPFVLPFKSLALEPSL